MERTREEKAPTHDVERREPAKRALVDGRDERVVEQEVVTVHLDLLVDAHDDVEPLRRELFLADEDLLEAGRRVRRRRPNEVGLVDEAVGRDVVAGACRENARARSAKDAEGERAQEGEDAPSPATEGNEWARSTQGEMSVAPAGMGRPRSRRRTRSCRTRRGVR